MSTDSSAPMTAATRKRLIEMSQVSQQVCERLFHVLVGLRRRNTSRLSRDLLRILDTHEFLVMLDFEMSVFIEDVVTAESDLRANLYTRTLLLTVYESSKSLRHMLNHEFRAAVLSVAQEAGLEDQLKEAHSQVTRLFARCEDEFSDVRNGLLGHRDRDAETRTQLLEKAETEHVMELTIGLMAALGLVIHALFLIWYTSGLAVHIGVGEVPGRA